MGLLSKNRHKELLDHIFGVAAYTPPTSLYLSLHTADPGDTGASECAYPGYTGAVRQPLSFTLAASNRTVTNAGGIASFPMATAGSETATFFGIWDSATVGAGTFIGGGSLVTNLVIAGGSIPKVYGDEIVVSWAAGTTVGMSTYLANALLNFVFRNQAFAVPVIELSLHTSESSDASIGTECVGTNYARKAVTAWDAAVIDASDVYVANTNQEDFASPSDGTWGNVVSLGVYDQTADQLLFYGNDLADLTVLAGVAVRAPAGDVKVRLS